MKQQTFGVIVSTRSFFPSHLVKTARAEIAGVLENLGFGCIMVSEEDTQYGAVRTFEEAEICARLFRKNRDRIEGILVILPNFGEELGIAEAITRSGLSVPVLVQACDDEPDKMDMANRRDAFCGKISVCNNLYQRGIPYSLTERHSCRIQSQSFARDLQRFAAVCRVVNGLSGARIAMLGARPAAFGTVRFSEKILQRHGISVQTADLSEIIFQAENYRDQEKIEKKIREIREYAKLPAGLDKDLLNRQARLCLAVENCVEELGCDASTIQCWDSLELNYGCAACLSMSMMGQKGKPSACESDVMGAVSMLAARLAAQSPPALMDWNNNWGDGEDMCVCLHCANFPRDFFQTEIELGSLDVLGSTLGRQNCFGACKGQVASGEMTFVRLTTDDACGVIKAYVGEGMFAPDPVPTKGGVVGCKVDHLQELMRHICRNGFEHHVCFVRGHVADALQEALGIYLGIEVYRHR